MANENKELSWPTEATIRQLALTDPAVHAAFKIAEMDGRSVADAVMLAVTFLSASNASLVSELLRARLAGFMPPPMTWPELDPLRRSGE